MDHKENYKKFEANMKKNKDRKRYNKRKRVKRKEDIQTIIEGKIVNKSDIKLDENDFQLLQLGLNFVPTPMWSNNLEKKEWNNLFHHIRRVEWNCYFQDSNVKDEDENINIIPSKLLIPKTNRPNEQQIDDKTKTYTQIVTNKLRNVKDAVTNNYRKKNNLNSTLLKSLQKIRKLVDQRIIVICKSDKDGKTIIVNYKDYSDIIMKNLETYHKLDYKTSEIDDKIKNIKTKSEKMVMKLYKSGDIDEDLLYHATGWKKNKNGVMQKITGTSAKHFANLSPGYVYPLFKTHKLGESEVEKTPVHAIPVRLVQSASSTFLCKIAAIL